jgi:hypothetical protein
MHYRMIFLCAYLHMTEGISTSSTIPHPLDADISRLLQATNATIPEDERKKVSILLWCFQIYILIPHHPNTKFCK